LPTTPVNLQTLYPSGLNVGLNLSNVSNNKFRGTATSAEYADLAERYASDRPLSFGTLVRIGGPYEITPTISSYDTEVFGVVSQNPAFLMNDNAGNDETHPPIALAGRVHVRTTGKVQKGQRIVSSEIPGVAKAAHSLNSEQYLAIVGRALESKDTEDEGLLLVAIGVK